MKHIYMLYLFLFLAIAAISSEGCSLIFYGIGSGIDNAKNNSRDTNSAFTEPLFHNVNGNVGKYARIKYNDSTIRFATFDGFAEEPDSSYHVRWNSFGDTHSNSSIIPFKIGDSIEVGNRPGSNDIQGFDKKNKPVYNKPYTCQYAGQFAGYSPSGIELRVSHNDPLFQLSLSSYNFVGVYGKGNSLPSLLSALDSNDVPVQAILKFSDRQKPFEMTNSDFYNATFIQSNSGKVGGLIFGAVIDVAAIIFLSMLSNSLSGLSNLGRI